jgi:protein-arginine kinase
VCKGKDRSYFVRSGYVLDNQLENITRIRQSHPGNIAVRCFDPDYFGSLNPTLQRRLLACMASGIEVPESEMGCYARFPDDYDVLRPFFSKVICCHHGANSNLRHRSDWSIPVNAGRGLELDVTDLGLPPLSMRMRVGRNLADMPLTSAMALNDRIALEDRMSGIFQKLQSDSEFGGTYVSLTPGHDQEVDAQEYQHLVNDHVMFKDMSADRYLVAAGIAADWPHGRGCYYSSDRSFIIWVGEEDHLRIMCMQTGTRLGLILNRLHKALEMIEAFPDVNFARSVDYGAVTTCPTNLGTGMRASVHLSLPKLTANGSDELVRKIAKPLGLAIRGLGGEHTPIGRDGTVDVSPRARLYVTEGEIASNLYDGIARLIEAEANCADA